MHDDVQAVNVDNTAGIFDRKSESFMPSKPQSSDGQKPTIENQGSSKNMLKNLGIKSQTTNDNLESTAQANSRAKR